MNNALFHAARNSQLTYAALARELGVQRAAVSKWARRGVPPRHVARVSALTGIPPHELCPDVFPAPASSLASVEDSPSASAEGAFPSDGGA